MNTFLQRSATVFNETIWKPMQTFSDKVELRNRLAFYYLMHCNILRYKVGDPSFADPIATGFSILKTYDARNEVSYSQFAEPLIRKYFHHEINKLPANPDDDFVFQVVIYTLLIFKHIAKHYTRGKFGDHIIARIFQRNCGRKLGDVFPQLLKQNAPKEWLEYRIPDTLVCGYPIDLHQTYEKINAFYEIETGMYCFPTVVAKPDGWVGGIAEV